MEHDFQIGFKATQETQEEIWFVFKGSKMLVKKDEYDIKIPYRRDIADNIKSNAHYIGMLDGCNCYCCELKNDAEILDGMELIELMALLTKLDKEVFFAAGRASQILNWDNTNKYCGRCGSLTENKEDERAKVCPACGLLSYPKISPAIIVAVTKGNKILLAHNRNFRNNVHSIIAGFVEPGETFEDCVKREVYEEVGIKVKNIKYFESQPWPFPNSMMVGFTAEHADGEIKVDGMEIDSADWYSPDEFPNLPNRGSIAWRIINSIVQKRLP